MKKTNIFIGILIFLLLGVTIYLVYDNFFYENKKEGNKEPEVNQNENQNNEEPEVNQNENQNNGEPEVNQNIIKDYDISKAKELLNYFGFNEIIGCGYIYDKTYSDNYKKIQAIENVEISKVKTVACSELYNNLDQSGYFYQGANGICKKDKETQVIYYDDVNQIYQKMYGETLEKQGFSELEMYKFYDYNENLNAFIKLECNGCGGACTKGVTINEIKSAKTIGNQLLIEVYYLHGFPFYDQTKQKYIYKLETTKITKDLEANNIEDFEKEILNNYQNKLDVYEIQFEKINDEYVLKKITKE